jgi:hypothetical protein
VTVSLRSRRITKTAYVLQRKNLKNDSGIALMKTRLAFPSSHRKKSSEAAKLCIFQHRTKHGMPSPEELLSSRRFDARICGSSKLARSPVVEQCSIFAHCPSCMATFFPPLTTTTHASKLRGHLQWAEWHDVDTARSSFRCTSKVQYLFHSRITDQGHRSGLCRR